MDDELLTYFNRELNYLRPLQAEFAEGHPKIAERLRLSADAVEDPHVRRLIDAVAFLTARVHRKLDDDFPELTDALLEVLYPHYLAPIPSMAILQMVPRKDLAGMSVVAAATELKAEAPGGDQCRFRTAYETELWPIAIEQAVLAGRPVPAPVNPYAPNAAAVLALTLGCLDRNQRFDKLQPDRLRFYLRGQPQVTRPLYELIMTGTVSIALADKRNDPAPVFLGRDHLHAVGFELEQAVLPARPRSFPGYRLLTEYFAFPEKFLFFEISGLGAKTLRAAGQKLELFLYLERSNAGLERAVSEETFALGCTPVVNLFRQRAEPIKLSQHLPEYRVVPDARRQSTTEVHTVERVVASAPGGAVAEYSPFYRPDHGGDRDQRRYWHAARRAGNPGDPGSEVYLSVVDLGFNPAAEQNWTLSVEITCLNRDLPSRLPFGGGQPRVEMIEGSTEIEQTHLLTPPTPTLRPPLGRGARWRLVSHLNLNHLSLTGDGEPLREILRLYNFRDSTETRAVIEGILTIREEPATARVSGVPTGICRGIEATLELAEGLAATGDGYLLAAVLERFLGLYVSLNGFTRLTARFRGRPDALRRWPARAGTRVLL
jgi:type VI secretion system protein ImpG